MVLNGTAFAELRTLAQGSTVRAIDEEPVRDNGGSQGPTVTELETEELREESAIRTHHGANETVC